MFDVTLDCNGAIGAGSITGRPNDNPQRKDFRKRRDGLGYPGTALGCRSGTTLSNPAEVLQWLMKQRCQRGDAMKGRVEAGSKSFGSLIKSQVP